MTRIFYLTVIFILQVLAIQPLVGMEVEVPRTEADVTKLNENIRQDEQQIQDMRKTAENIEDPETRKQIESHADELEKQLKLDKAAAQAGQKYIDWQDIQQDPTKTGPQKSKAQQDYQNAINQFDSLKKSLESEFIPSGQPTGLDKATYDKQLRDQLRGKSIKDQLTILNSLVGTDISNKYPNYTDQKVVLESITDQLNRFGISENDPLYKQEQVVRNKIATRLSEINTLEQHMSLGIPGNAIDMEFDLGAKIPLDRTANLRKVMLQFDQTYETTSEKIKALHELTQIIDVYKINDPVLRSQITRRLLQYDPNSLRTQIALAPDIAQKNIIFTVEYSAALAKPSYQEQRVVLKNIESVAKDYSSESPETTDFVNNISGRINEINQFLQRRPAEPAAPTPLEQKLELWNKIPSDQIKGIGQEITEITQKQPIDETHLNELTDLMKKYQLDQLYPDVSKQLTALKPSFLSKAINRVTEYVSTIAKPVIDVASNALEGAADLASQAVTTVSTVVDTGIRESAKIFANQAFDMGLKLEDLGKQMQEAPDQIDNVLSTLGQIQDSWIAKSYLKGLALYLTPALGRANVEKLSDLAVNGFVKGKESLEQIQEYKTNIQEFSQKIVEYGKVFQSASESLANVFDVKEVKQAIDARNALNDATDIINANRGDIVPPKTTVQRFTDTISNFIKDIKNKLVTVFSPARKTEITAAKTYYESTRKQLLTALGLEEGAAKDAIAKALQEKANNSQVIKAQKTFNEALNNLGQLYEKTNNQMVGAFGNLEFLVKAWDSVQLPKDPRQLTTQSKDLVNLVTMINDYRNQKLGYLVASQVGVQQLKDGINDITTDPDFQEGINSYIDKVNTALSGEIINTLDSHQQEMQYVNDFINAQKKNIDLWLQSYTEQATVGQTESQGPASKNQQSLGGL